MFTKTTATALLALLASVATAAPRPVPGPYGPDDVILLKSDGSTEVMKAADYDAALASRAVSENPQHVSQTLPKRCDETTEIQVLTDETFLNWDIAISPVLASLGGSAATVSVSAGYQLSNSITIDSSVSAGLDGFISSSLGVSVSESWTTTQDQSLSFEVPDGQYGVIVSQPQTRRRTGIVYSGCNGADQSTFTTDSYSSQQVGNLAWVTGAIRLCSSETYPIPFCIGDGSHS